MKVLVVGGGGREHAIVWKLLQSARRPEVYCAPGNGGIPAECVPIPATDIDKMVAFSKDKAIDLVIVAPDDPLAMGMVDALTDAGIRAFGPTKRAARIESSKIFSKTLMRKYAIPTAAWSAFSDVREALEYLKTQQPPIVVKADGLALGKGVVVAQTPEEAENAVREMMLGGKFSDAGRRVVIEEYLTGPEVTVLAFCDGKTVLPMPSSQDHKRIGEGDTGLNTGGMGAISPVPAYTPEIAGRCMNEIFLPTVRAMEAEGCPFSGILYFGLMLTPSGPKVIEYNARFGDPEAQALLIRLETDLLDIFDAVIDQKLDRTEIQWSSKSSCVVVLASEGYPGAYRKGELITGIENIGGEAVVFHAGTARQASGVITSGGRVLGVAALGDSLGAAIDFCYANLDKINYKGKVFRRDIGRKAL